MRTSKEIIRLIKNLRVQKEMSVEELANRVGIAKSTLSRYENEHRDFTVNDIGLYANALGTSIEYLLGIKKEIRTNGGHQMKPTHNEWKEIWKRQKNEIALLQTQIKYLEARLKKCVKEATKCGYGS